MIQCSNSNIQFLKINYVGNRILGEKVKISKEILQCDDLTKGLVGRYLLLGMEYHTHCGYRSDAFVKKMFLARTGLTMREYRKSTLQQSSRR